MNTSHRIHWGRIVIAAFLAEASVMAGFFLLLFIATTAGVPEIAQPMSPLDYVDAIVASFVTVFLFTLWVGKRIESRFVLHGVLVGVVAVLLFVTLIYAVNKTFAEPPLYIVAHAMKILGGIAGGLVAEKRRRAVTAAVDRPMAATNSA
jgi:putative membrane protein (TIGR04086 family)